MHPLEGSVDLRKQKDKEIKLIQKINCKTLEKFKLFLEANGNRRLPMVVRSAL